MEQGQREDCDNKHRFLKGSLWIPQGDSVIPWLLQDILFSRLEGKKRFLFFSISPGGLCSIWPSSRGSHTGPSGIYNNVPHLCV